MPILRTAAERRAYSEAFSLLDRLAGGWTPEQRQAFFREAFELRLELEEYRDRMRAA